VPAACGDSSIASTVPHSGIPAGVTSVHTPPPSRVRWTRPSSVPTQSVRASCGETAIEKIVP